MFLVKYILGGDERDPYVQELKALFHIMCGEKNISLFAAPK